MGARGPLDVVRLSDLGQVELNHRGVGHLVRVRGGVRVRDRVRGRGRVRVR